MMKNRGIKNWEKGLLLCLLLCVSFAVNAQTFYVGSNTTIKLEGNAVIDDTLSSNPSLYVEGNIENNGTLSNSGELQLTGDLNNNNLFEGNGDEVFAGTNLQAIDGNFVSANGFNNLVIAKNSNHIELNTNVAINNHLNLAKGWIDGNGFTTTINSSAQDAIENGGNSGTFNNYIAGTVSRAVNTGINYSLPVGNTTDGCQKVQLNFSNLGGGSYVTAYYSSDSLGSVNVTACSGTLSYTTRSGNWNVSMNGTNGTYNYSISLFPAGNNNLSSSTFDAMRKDGVFVTNECATSTGNYTANNLTSFSSFVVLGGATILPVELLAFDGYWVGKNAVLNWITEKEINSGHFIVERLNPMNGNNDTWEAIAKVNAAGTSFEPIPYEYQDINAYLNFAALTHALRYRLKIIDKDGSYSYSNVVELPIFQSNGAFTVYPNPTNGEINIAFSGKTASKYTLYVYDVNGKSILAQSYDPVVNPVTTLQLHEASNGIYFIKIADQYNSVIEVAKIIKY